MYLKYYNMTEMPFALLPDTNFFYESDSYREALNVLLVAIRSGEGFVKVTGEVGTGKTMLCRKLLNSLDDSYLTVYIPNPYLTPNQLRMALAEELGVEYRHDSEDDISGYRLMNDITRCLIAHNKAGRRVVVCLDEVQAMPVETLEALRLISNIETEKNKLLQIILFGQPELDERLNNKCNRQLKQRISFSYKLRPVDRQCLSGYINHRLRVAGYNGGELFTRRAIERIHKYSKGVPRIVNTLCNKSLLLAFGQGKNNVGREHVNLAIADNNDRSTVAGGRYLVLAASLCVMLSISIWVMLT